MHVAGTAPHGLWRQSKFAAPGFGLGFSLPEAGWLSRLRMSSLLRSGSAVQLWSLFRSCERHNALVCSEDQYLASHL
jgi:hypothetical protein